MGEGEHGFIRVHTGDWSDGIVFEAPNRADAIARGESVPNTQMGAAVIPWAADLVETFDAPLAAEMRARAAGWRAALPAAWTGSFYGRAWFGDGVLRYADAINLEAQVWALIGNTFLSGDDRAALLDAIATQLDEPNATGAPLLRGGQVWPAISGLLTWGCSSWDPARAWAHLARNTMTAHAKSFPDVWYGIWSGPDGMEARSGTAWASPVTPMKDFPTMNNNQHAMPMLAALRVAGVQGVHDGIVVAPGVAEPRLALRTALLDVMQDDSTLRVTYRPTGTAPRVIHVKAPAGSTIAQASLDGRRLAPVGDALDVPIAASPAELVVRFSQWINRPNGARR